MIDRHKDKHTDIMIDRHKDKHKDIMIDRHKDKHTDMMINGHTFVGEGIEVGINNVICKQGFRSGTTLP